MLWKLRRKKKKRSKWATSCLVSTVDLLAFVGFLYFVLKKWSKNTQTKETFLKKNPKGINGILYNTQLMTCVHGCSFGVSSECTTICKCYDLSNKQNHSCTSTVSVNCRIFYYLKTSISVCVFLVNSFFCHKTFLWAAPSPCTFVAHWQQCASPTLFSCGLKCVISLLSVPTFAFGAPYCDWVSFYYTLLICSGLILSQLPARGLRLLEQTARPCPHVSARLVSKHCYQKWRQFCAKGFCCPFFFLKTLSMIC